MLVRCGVLRFAFLHFDSPARKGLCASAIWPKRVTIAEDGAQVVAKGGRVLFIRDCLQTVNVQVFASDNSLILLSCLGG